LQSASVRPTSVDVTDVRNHSTGAEDDRPASYPSTLHIPVALRVTLVSQRQFEKMKNIGVGEAGS
jgi:hypothetical protein